MVLSGHLDLPVRSRKVILQAVIGSLSRNLLKKGQGMEVCDRRG